MKTRIFWRAVMARDPRFDGAFVYGVRSTGVYCRPSCPSRKPRVQQVVYFPKPAEAERAGFRACRRCRPREARLGDREVAVALRVCRAIESARNGGVTLHTLGRMTGMSPSRLQRTFTRIVGVTPKTYAEAFRMDRMKALLRSGTNHRETTGVRCASSPCGTPRTRQRSLRQLSSAGH